MKKKFGLMILMKEKKHILKFYIVEIEENL